MKGPTKALVAVGVLGSLAALVVVTKPGPKVARGRDRGALQPPSRPAQAPDAAATSTALVSGRPPVEPVAAPTAANTAFAEHGRDAVLRTEAAEGGADLGLLPAAAPARWSDPRQLKFFHLKKHYRAHRKAGGFAPELVRELSGAAVTMTGAFMPIDPIPDDGKVGRFWLANPVVVMAGCVFCAPPTLGDLVYVTTGDDPIEVDREKLFRGVLILELLGRLRLGPQTTPDGVQYLFGLELRQRLE